MQTTLDLLERALDTHDNARELSRSLGLGANTLNAAKARGHLSPAVAGAIAEKLGEDPQKWIVIAALESEKDSACKDSMLRRFARAFRES
jgi:hypothetical protein